MIEPTPIQFTKLDNGRWKAYYDGENLGDHLAFGDNKQEAEEKIRAGLKRQNYAITHTADGYFG